MAMIQRPNAVGLIICRLLIVEEKTRNITLANSFVRLEVDSFPSHATPFDVYAILTDGLGDVALDLFVARGDTMDEIYARSFKVTFDDPLRQRIWWRIRSCSFPVPGPYQIGVQADGELISQGVLKVVRKGEVDA